MTLFQALLGNVGTSRADVKGEIQVGSTARMSVPMRRTGAEQLVVVMKRGNARGAKGPCLLYADSERGETACRENLIVR